MSDFTPAPASADLGVFGLGVMGANLARNLARHGHSVAVFNRTLARTERLMERYGSEGDFIPASDLKDFVASLRTRRVAIIMVQAGAATEAVIEELSALMEPGDIIVDAGNTLYTDTRRREEALRERGLHFVGMGVSGGEEGALLGPSIMPGGTAESYNRLGPMLESISAHVDGEPCCTHVGPDGAGHFVKMVHNGIEYADMQLIAEAYSLLRYVAGLSVPEIAEVFRSWKDSELDSYLIDITTEVLSRTDPVTGRPFVDVVVDAAGQLRDGGRGDDAVLGQPSHRVHPDGVAVEVEQAGGVVVEAALEPVEGEERLAQVVATGGAGFTLPAGHQEAPGHPVADGQPGVFVVGPDLHHLARHLVAQDAGGGEGDCPADDVQVGMAHSAGGDLDQHLAGPGPRGADGFHLHAVGDVSQDGSSHRLGDGWGHWDHSSFATSRLGFERCYARQQKTSRQIGDLFALNA